MPVYNTEILEKQRQVHDQIGEDNDTGNPQYRGTFQNFFEVSDSLFCRQKVTRFLDSISVIVILFVAEINRTSGCPIES